MALDPVPLSEPSPDGPPLPPRDRRIAFAVLLAGVACIGMGQTVVFAVLPPLARGIGLADFQVAAIFMLSAMFWVLLGPFWGRRSDAGGRKRYILLGFAGFTISMLLFASSIRLGLVGAMSGAGLYALILAARSIYGIIGSATPGAALGYIADRTPPERRTAGVSGFSAAFGVGAMLGPGVGGAFAAFGPLAPLYAVGALGGLMTALIYVFLPERNTPLPPARRKRLKITDARLRPFLIFGLAFGVINAVPIQTTAFYFMDVLALSPEDAPQYAGVGLMAASMASLFSQLVLVQRFAFPPHVLMRVAPALIIAGHATIMISDQLGPLVFGLVLSGMGAGMAIPGFNAAASLAVGPDEQGAAAGLANAAGASGFVLAPLIAFSLYAMDPRAPYLMTTAMGAALLAFALASRLIRGAGRSP